MKTLKFIDKRGLFLTDTTDLISGKMKIEDSLEEITELFCERGWTDELPMLLLVILGGT
jgi:hypothetical protein